MKKESFSGIDPSTRGALNFSRFHIFDVGRRSLYEFVGAEPRIEGNENVLRSTWVNIVAIFGRGERVIYTINLSRV